MPTTPTITSDLHHEERGTRTVNGVRPCYEERSSGASEVAGKSAWRSFPDELRRMFTQNGPAILAELNGEWLHADAAAVATIDQPVLLVGATDSRPEFREPNEMMADAFPNTRTALVGGGHLINPAASEVLAFIEAVLASP